jgi:hypothetical protein
VFIRWGMIVALAGVLLTVTSARFLFGGLKLGAILVLAGVGMYYYGRFARKESIFVTRR